MNKTTLGRMLLLGWLWAGAASVAVADSVGELTFTVDGEPKRFGYVPESQTSCTPYASSFVAFPEEASAEHLSITFLSINLKKLSYPTDLPQPKDFSKPMDPLAAMANVGFSYVDPQGLEWAGPARLRIESFGNDGVIRGTFDGVTLRHTDKERPDLDLGGGSFTVQLASPW